MTLAPPAGERQAPPRPPSPGWSIHWRGRVWHESDLTVQHLAVMALLTGDDDFASLDLAAPEDHPAWERFKHAHAPWRGYMRLFFTLVAFLAVEREKGDGAALAEIVHELQSATAEELLGCLQPG